jgi:bis(5'-nucleosidyl)-tetraphosphatase
MQIDWKKFVFEHFDSAIPEIVRLYFGKEIRPEKEGHNELGFFYKNLRVLHVIYQSKRVNWSEITGQARYLAKKEARAGLIVSSAPQKYHFRLVEASNNWFPLAVWGRKDVDAIAAINSEFLSKTTPFIPRTFSRASPPAASPPRPMGKGGVLWSDIVAYTPKTVDVGLRIAVSPVEIRDRLMDRVDLCFWEAGRSRTTFSKKIGADGWYFFCADPNGSEVTRLAIDCWTLLQRKAAYDPIYGEHEFKVGMGINQADNVVLKEGDPFDEDSIIAYLLVKERYMQYDIRATDRAVTTLIGSANAAQWLLYTNLLYYDGRTVNIYGYQPTGNTWSSGAIVFLEQQGELRYLLLRRRASAFWDFPMGKKNLTDRTPRDTAEREVEEETGIKTQAIAGFEHLSTYSVSQGASYGGSVHLFVAEAQNQQVRLDRNHEHDTFEWLPLDEAIRRLSLQNSRDALLRAHGFLVVRRQP